VAEMDEVTQQNAALVEQMAAAAASLKPQAQDLVQTVAVFKLGTEARSQVALPSPRVRAPALKSKPFKGLDRRTEGGSKGVAAKSTSSPSQRAAMPPAPQPASSTASAADWEVF